MQHGPVLRIPAFAKATGYVEATIRKKLHRREIDYFKVGRVIVIPEREVSRLLGELKPRVEE